MTETTDPKTMPDMFFDIWFMPAAFWTQWCGFYAQTLNLLPCWTDRGIFGAKESPVDVEVEEGLVA